MYQPVVQLKSGGYLVINPTEALVSIDINSGRSTREHNIEQTAFSTNLEAATEIARQLRLRDMAGLIVIDFIDMEQNSHVRKVEKAMKEALKNDRARIQVGRISSFGLMEMSRQRLRTGVLEASTKPCPHCEGTGLMRTAASAGLSALRIIEDEAARGRGEKVLLRAGREAAVYVLNKKRSELADIEHRYGVSIEIAIDESFEGAKMAVEASGPRPVAVPREAPIVAEEEEDDEEEILEISLEEDAAEARDAYAEEGGREERQGRRRRRRRRGGRGRGRREGADSSEGLESVDQAPPSEQSEEPADQSQDEPETVLGAEPKAPRKRRRGGKRKDVEAAVEATVEPDSSPMVERPIEDEPPIAETQLVEETKPKRRRSRKAAAEEAPVAVAEPAPFEAPPVETVEEAAPAPDAPTTRARKPRAKKSTAKESPSAEPAPADSLALPEANNDTAPGQGGEPRRGWWQRTFG
jgi:ribonuclease E